jgi:hypothetical protein
MHGVASLVVGTAGSPIDDGSVNGATQLVSPLHARASSHAHDSVPPFRSVPLALLLLLGEEKTKLSAKGGKGKGCTNTKDCRQA